MQKALLTIIVLAAAVSSTEAVPELVWCRVFGGEGSESCHSMLVTENSELLLAGYTSSTGAGGGDAYVIRMNIEGDTIWTRTFGTDSLESAWDIIVTPEGNYHAASPWSAVCFDDSGDTLWTRAFTCPAWMERSDMVIASDGNYVRVGSNQMAAVIAKYDSCGQELWLSLFDAGEPYDCFFGMIATSDSGFLGTG
ncbi:hypothetical protein KKC97_02280 [bacterium]|nr:hypothetical protein [bacterium]MBU1636470.1 hypothetical protein [bacterium]MBU1919564.1 hypothetical protein [bacterium]